MKKKFMLSSIAVMLLALTVAMPAPASAQADDPATKTPADSQAKEEDEEPGKGKLSEFGDTLSKFWSVSSAFQAMESLDDNVFLANNFRKTDTFTKLSGRMTVAYRGQHTRFEATYMPEFNIYQHYEPLNYAAHNYSQSFTHDFTRRLEMHWNLGVYQAPSRGNLPFKSINFGGYRSQTFALDALSDGLTLLNGTNNIGMSYRWTPRIKVSANIDGAATHFRVRGTPAVNPVTKDVTYSVGAKLGVEYTLNARQTLGITASNTYFSSLDATGGVGLNDHQHYQSMQVTFTQKMPNKFTFFGSVGPGFTERQGAPDPQLGVFFDVGVSRQLLQSGYAVSFRRTTQVGLLQDTLTGYSVTARANRNFGRKWTSSVGGSYLRSEGSNGLQQSEYVTAHTQISYRMTPQLSPVLNYGFMHQKALVPRPDIRNVDRNSVSLGFVYNFGVIAGR
jgi:hypothetical protein